MRPVIKPSAIESKPQLNVMGQIVDTLIAGRETQGTLAICLIDCPAAGLGVPTHTHGREDETFHVLEGKLRVVIGGVETILTPGQTGFGPRGVAHSWVALEPSKLIVTATPSGLEEMFVELDRVPVGPGHMDEVLAICSRYGIEFA